MNLDLNPMLQPLSQEALNSLPESIQDYIRYLETTLQRQQAIIKEQQIRIGMLTIRVNELEARLSKDSSNV